MAAKIRRTYKNSDAELEDPYGLAGHGVAQGEENEDIGCGEQDATPKREFREEHAECDGRAEELCEVCADDGDLGEGIEGVEDGPAPEPGVFRAVVEEDAAVRGEVCGRVG